MTTLTQARRNQLLKEFSNLQDQCRKVHAKRYTNLAIPESDEIILMQYVPKGGYKWADAIDYYNQASRKAHDEERANSKPVADVDNMRALIITASTEEEAVEQFNKLLAHYDDLLTWAKQ